MFVTLQTVEIKDNRIYYGYWIAFWLLAVQGLISLVQWRSNRRSLDALVQMIRSLMPERPGVSEQLTTSSEPEVASLRAGEDTSPARGQG